MLATKNSDGSRACLYSLLALVALLGGCTPPGPRSLLDGEKLLAQKRYPEAIARLTTATQLLPNHAQAWNHLGLAYHAAGQPTPALKAYQAALQRDPNLTIVYYNLGCLYLERNLPQNAVSELTKFTLLRNDHPDVWAKLATAQLRSRQYDAAEKTLSGLLQTNGRDSSLLNSMGVVQVQKRRVRESLNYFASASQANPGFAPSLLNQAVVIHTYFNNKPLALQRYREYLAAAPKAANASEVGALVHQLEVELAPPPPKPAPLTNAVAAFASGTSRPPVTHAATNVVATVISNPPPSLVTTQQALVTIKPVLPPPPAAAPTNLVVAQAPVSPAPKPSPSPVTAPPEATAPAAPKVVDPPKVVAPKPAQLPVQVVQTIEEPPPKLPEEPRPAPPAPAASTNVVAEAARTNAPGSSDLRIIRPPEKRGILDRMNPVGWFRGKEKSTNAPVVEAKPSAPAPATGGIPIAQAPPMPAVAAPPPAPERRYNYTTPPKPQPGDRAQATRVFNEAVDAHQRGGLQTAADLYRRVVQLDPTYFEAHNNLGLVSYDLKQPEAALPSYEAALAVNPTFANGRYNFALALEAAGYHRDAANELEKLLLFSPGETRAHLTLAHVYGESMDRVDMARTHYRRVLELEPQHPEGLRIREWLRSHE